MQLEISVGGRVTMGYISFLGGVLSIALSMLILLRETVILKLRLLLGKPASSSQMKFQMQRRLYSIEKKILSPGELPSQLSSQKMESLSVKKIPEKFHLDEEDIKEAIT